MNKLILLLSLYFIFGCNSQKIFENGDYEKAYAVALNKIHKEKDIHSNVEILNNSLQKLLDNKSLHKNSLILSQDASALELALLVNSDMQILIQNAEPHLNDSFIEELSYLESEEDKLRNDCAQRYFNMGFDEFQNAKLNDDKSLARIAYKDFLKAESYEFKDIVSLSELIEESFEFAQVLYCLEDDYYHSKFDKWSESNANFIKIQALNSVTEPDCDCIVEFHFDRPITKENESTSKKKHEKEIENGFIIEKETDYIVNSDGETEQVVKEKRVSTYETIHATVTTIETTKVCRSNVTIKVSSQSANCLIRDKTLCARVEDSNQIVKVTGDKNAISGSIPSSKGSKRLDSDSKMERNVKLKLENAVCRYLISSIR